MSDTLIVSSDRFSRSHDDAFVVATPLEAIVRLERWRVRTVVLAGTFASNCELAAFLRAFYPRVRIEREV
jgi:hypothetical protein